ncbi:MAG: hypothetical protein HGA36_03645 [Candidatus Moranbacteria bacterium]|nr:hypothetical protein [Candidatus Moranbacteria bacterium]
MDIEKTKSILLKIVVPMLVLVLFIVVGLVVFDNISKKKLIEKVRQENLAVHEAAKIAIQAAKDAKLNNSGESSEPENDNLFLAKLGKCESEPVADFKQQWRQKSNGYSLVYASMYAISEKKATFCEEVLLDSDDISICHDRYNLLMNMNNGNMDCGIIKDGEMNAYCVALHAKDADVCIGLDTDLAKRKCKAIFSKNVNDCDGLNENDMNMCKGSVLLGMAISKGDLAGCDDIKYDSPSGRFNLEYCKLILSPDPKNEWSKFYASDVCYEKYASSVAGEKKDTSFCEKIPLKMLDNKIAYESCMESVK